MEYINSVKPPWRVESVETAPHAEGLNPHAECNGAHTRGMIKKTKNI